MAEKEVFRGLAGIQALFSDRQAFFTTFEERRRAYEEMCTAHEQRRATFLAEKEKGLADLERVLSDEISTTQDKLAEVAPVTREEPTRVPLNRMAYSDRMAALMAKLSLLSYIGYEADVGRAVLERLLSYANMRLLGVFCQEDTEAFVAEAEGFVVAAFRGTTSKRDRKTDMRFRMSMTKVEGHKKNIKVHSGFYEAFRLIEQPMHELLAQTSGYKPIFLTGHSLGGALALVASAAYSGLDTLGPRIGAVYTFGAPRVGDASFETVVKAPHHRLINQFDLVPHVPPSWISGYRHSGDPLVLKRNRMRPIRSRPWGSAFVLAILSMVLWPFGRPLLFLTVHDIALYASRLEVIANERGSWS